MNPIRNNDFVTACHEAGHAAGAYFLGIAFGNVAINEEDDAEGSVHSILTVAEIRLSGLAWQHAIIAMLGQEAERMVFGHADRRYLGADAAMIGGLYRTFFKSEMTRQHFRAELR